MRLTKKSDALICLLYKEYCQKVKSGASRQKTKMFGGSSDIQETIVPKWSVEDVDDCCFELSDKGLLDVKEADNCAYFVWLSNDGIIYMENRFKNGLKGVLNHLSKIASFLPI